MDSVKGKAVVVTGSGNGLGRAYAGARAAAGARVVVNDIAGARLRAVAGEIKAAGGVAEASARSIAEDGEAEALIADCCDTFGGIDGLINNAGLFTFGPADELDFAAARQLFEVNVFGLLRCGVAAIGRMSPERRGTILNVTSGASIGMPALGTYGASKGAVDAIIARGQLALLEAAQFTPIAEAGPWTAEGIAAAIAPHIAQLARETTR